MSSVCRKSFIALGLALALPVAPVFAATLADCTNVYAYGSIDNLSHSSGTVSADGYWGVGGDANQVYLEYYIDGTTYASETRYGVSGYWDFSDNYSGTCVHDFEVMICPMVCDGGGCATCIQDCELYDDEFVAQPCSPTLTLEDCEITGGSTGVWAFDASASGGVPDSSGNYTYKTQWYQNGTYYTPSSSYSYSPWDYSGRCSTSNWTVGLRVIDHAGQYSNTVTCSCSGPIW